jgi:Tsi6
MVMAMAGVYGEINSREDCHRVLSEALDITQRILAKQPNYAVMQRIHTELDAIKKWTEKGREPSKSERKSVNIGLIAAREFENAKGELAVLVDKLCCLNNYFEAWPTDEKAATATDEDFFEDEEHS